MVLSVCAPRFVEAIVLNLVNLSPMSYEQDRHLAQTWLGHTGGDPRPGRAGAVRAHRCGAESMAACPAIVWRIGVTRQMVFERSSATISAPRGSKIGRAHV